MRSSWLQTTRRTTSRGLRATPGSSLTRATRFPTETMSFVPSLPRDRVVLITGASSGIGRATAMAFAADGARVVLAARRRDTLDALAKEIGPAAIAVTCDVRERAQVRAAVDAAVAKFGALHIAVANAGFGVYHSAAQ